MSTQSKKVIISDVCLAALFCIMACIILLRVNAEGTSYISPDSESYLALAQSLKEDNGFYVQNEHGRYYFSIWPVGYPLLIYLVSVITTLDVLWSSKLLNFILLATGFLFLRKLHRPYAFILASVYGAYTFMEVYSFTWSEAPFLLFILLLAFIACQILQGNYQNSWIICLLLCCFALFLLRYIGALYFAIPLTLSIYYWYKRNYGLSAKLLVVALLLTIAASVYLYINYIETGFLTGGERFAQEKPQPLSAFLLMSLKGLLNEFLIIREYRPQNQPDYLLYITALIQVAVLTCTTIKVRRHYNYWRELRQNSFSMICLGIAFLYLAAIIAMRFVSHFDALDYRLLAPFSFPLFIGLVYAFVSLPDKHKDIVQAKYVLFAFFLLSLLLNLPKKFILQQLQQIL